MLARSEQFHIWFDPNPKKGIKTGGVSLTFDCPEAVSYIIFISLSLYSTLKARIAFSEAQKFVIDGVPVKMLASRSFCKHLLIILVYRIQWYYQIIIYSLPSRWAIPSASTIILHLWRCRIERSNSLCSISPWIDICRSSRYYFQWYRESGVSPICRKQETSRGLDCYDYTDYITDIRTVLSYSMNIQSRFLSVSNAIEGSCDNSESWWWWIWPEWWRKQ